MMVETRPWAFGCLVWVVLGLLVLFSTIRLFFPPFNDDLGTMPTRRRTRGKKTALQSMVAYRSNRQGGVPCRGIIWDLQSTGASHVGIESAVGTKSGSVRMNSGRWGSSKCSSG